MENSFICPVCGEEVAVSRKSCPSCGACEQTGWNEEYIDNSGGFNESDDDFDYEKFIEKEFGGGESKKRLDWSGIVVILLIVALFIAFVFRG